MIFVAIAAKLEPTNYLRLIPVSIIQNEGLTPLQGLILPAVAGITALKYKSIFMRAGFLLLITLLLIFIAVSIVTLALIGGGEVVEALELPIITLKTFVSAQLSNYVLYQILIGLKSRPE